MVKTLINRQFRVVIHILQMNSDDFYDSMTEVWKMINIPFTTKRSSLQYG